MPFNATDYDGPIDFIGSTNEIAAEIVHQIAITRTAAA
jgi:two-component system, chemotaxis family, protein-glutamate methylesterase/glutaminase